MNRILGNSEIRKLENPLKLTYPGVFLGFGEPQPIKLLYNVPIVSFLLNGSNNLPNEHS